jgi:hypothetical protein
MATKKPAAKTAAKPVAKKATPKVVVPDVEISPPFVMTDKWTFKCNDEVVSKSVFESMMKDHDAYVAEQAKAALAADTPEKKTRKKK